MQISVLKSPVIQCVVEVRAVRQIVGPSEWAVSPQSRPLCACLQAEAESSVVWALTHSLPESRAKSKYSGQD